MLHDRLVTSFVAKYYIIIFQLFLKDISINKIAVSRVFDTDSSSVKIKVFAIVYRSGLIRLDDLVRF